MLKFRNEDIFRVLFFFLLKSNVTVNLKPSLVYNVFRYAILKSAVIILKHYKVTDIQAKSKCFNKKKHFF